MVLIGKRKMHRNRLRAGAHLQLNPVVLNQQRELLQVVVGIQVGARQRRLKTARARNKTVAQARIFQQARARNGVGLHPHKRVAGAHMPWQGFTRHKPAHGTSQVGQAAVVNLARLGQRGGRVAETGGGNEVRQVGHGAIVHGLPTPLLTHAIDPRRADLG